MEILDLRTLADEWQERIDEMSSSVPNTEGMSWGELAEATEAFLAEPEQVEFVKQYTDLCDELGISPAEPSALRWYADNRDGTLIAEDSFEDYARELAEDIGAIEDDAHWPATCIDWERAADELKMDYTAIEYDGDTYYTRS